MVGEEEEPVRRTSNARREKEGAGCVVCCYGTSVTYCGLLTVKLGKSTLLRQKLKSGFN